MHITQIPAKRMIIMSRVCACNFHAYSSKQICCFKPFTVGLHTMDFLLKEFKVIIFMYSIIQGYAQSMRLSIRLCEFISVCFFIFSILFNCKLYITKYNSTLGSLFYTSFRSSLHSLIFCG